MEACQSHWETGAGVIIEFSGKRNLVRHMLYVYDIMAHLLKDKSDIL